MEKRPPAIDDPRSILIIKLSAIGDVVHTLPFLEVLRQRYPQARIDWLVEEEASALIGGHEAIDSVIISRRKSWQKGLFPFGAQVQVLGEIIQFLKGLRSRKYDLVIDLQGLFKSGLMIGLSRGRRKVGFTGGREGSFLFLTERPFPVNYEQHALERYLEAAAHLGCSTSSWEGTIPLSESEETSVQKIMAENGLHDKAFVAINPMARWKTKLWEPEKFAQLAERIQDELSLKVVFTGSKQDQKILTHILDMMKKPALSLSGRIGLRELACLYSRCRLVISTDTGPMHIAAAMRCPVVALFGPTSPWRTGPYGQRHRVIREEVTCGPCFNKKCEHMSCMKGITVVRVLDAVKELIEWGRG